MRAIASDVLVVGGGPAGMSAILALLPQDLRVAWVDPSFASGRLARWRAVPCNTKVDLLVGAKFFGHPLFDPIRGAMESPLRKLTEGARHFEESPDPSSMGWTTLGEVKEVYDAVTAHLVTRESVSALRGEVTSLRPCPTGGWTATLRSDADSNGLTGSAASEGMETVSARWVILATGSEPRGSSSGSRGTLSPEVTFDATALQASIAQGALVAVLGNSHTAAVVLAKLLERADAMGLRLANFARRPVRHAEWMPELGTYKFTSTGLKGFGSVFGRSHMQGSSGKLPVRPIEEFAASEWDHVIDCTGYVPSAVPHILDAHGSRIDEAVAAPKAATPRTALELALPRDEATGQLAGLRDVYGLGAPWSEPAGRFWGCGLEKEPGFAGEDSFIGFHLFLSRAEAIAAELASSRSIQPRDEREHSAKRVRLTPAR